MFLVFMNLFPPLSLILCDIMSSPRDAVSLCLNYLFEQTQNIAASIHPVGYFSEQLPCTDTYMLACLLCWCGMSSASFSLASLQVSNKHECIAYSSFRAWLTSGDAIFPTGLAATGAAATGAADKVLVLDLNHGHLLFWGKFILQWKSLYFARAVRDFVEKV